MFDLFNIIHISAADFNKFISILIISGATITLNYLIQRSLHAVGRAKNVPISLSLLIGKTAKYLVFGVGFITILGLLGIHIGPIIASLGVGGLAISFALKDMIANIISGVLIIIYRPFTIGDYVDFKPGNKDYEGRVIDINLRYITIETTSNRTLVPNSVIISNPISIRK